MPHNQSDAVSDDLLRQELAHYRERWRATEHLSDQRLTALLTALGTAVALSTAILAHGTVKGGVDSYALLSGLWAVMSVVSEGIFLRLVRARRSICPRHQRDKHPTNRTDWNGWRVRSEDASTHCCCRLNTSQDFAIASAPTAASIVVSCSLFVCPWFADSGLSQSPPALSYVFFGIGMLTNLGWFWRSERVASDIGSLRAVSLGSPGFTNQNGA